jgi:uncharacterized membrane protein
MDNNNIVVEPRAVMAGRGASWLVEGFGFFKRDWLAWIGLTIVLIILGMVLSIIPIANIMLMVISPVIVAGLMLGCRQQDRGGEISIGALFAGFSERPGQLMLIGVAYLVASIAITILMVILVIIMVGSVEALAELGGDNPDLLLEHSINLLLAALIGMSLYVPVVMAIWFASAIVVFHNVTAIDAMQLSFKACMQNVLPFLVYGVVALILCFIASIPLLLGWLVLIPVLTASVYLSYKDIFVNNTG